MYRLVQIGLMSVMSGRRTKRVLSLVILSILILFRPIDLRVAMLCSGGPSLYSLPSTCDAIDE
jgi:hypothetical protein